MFLLFYGLRVQHNQYQHKTLYNKTYVQFVILIGLVLSIIILYFTSAGVIEQTVGYGSVFMIGFIVIIYYIYRIYIHRMNRDKFHWHKTQYERIETSNNTNQVVDDNSDKISDNSDKLNYNDLDRKANKEFKKYKSTC